MKKRKILFTLILILSTSVIFACRYTIREIGFSSLSKVNYVLYRIDKDASFITSSQKDAFSNSNIIFTGLSLNKDQSNRILQYVKDQDLAFPAYVLAAPDGRMLVLKGDLLKDHPEEKVLNSPVRQRLITEMPSRYAAVILVEGLNPEENLFARANILKACDRIENVMPNMPKIVGKGPELISIKHAQFDEEKVMLWSLDIDQIPDHPIAFVTYGRGRIMGKQIGFDEIKSDKVYKLLSIIGADCECGLDRKWILGYQIPINWPDETQQKLNDILGFDVENPMILTEMSRILSIENKVASDPDGITFEPVVVDLDKEFNDVPAIDHQEIPPETKTGTGTAIIYSLIIFIVLTGIGAFYILRRK